MPHLDLVEDQRRAERGAARAQRLRGTRACAGTAPPSPCTGSTITAHTFVVEHARRAPATSLKSAKRTPGISGSNGSRYGGCPGGRQREAGAAVEAAAERDDVAARQAAARAARARANLSAASIALGAASCRRTRARSRWPRCSACASAIAGRLANRFGNGRAGAATGYPRAFFCNSGTEGIEAALKFARARARTRGLAGPRRVAFHGGFHGRTGLALSATWTPVVPRAVRAADARRAVRRLQRRRGARRGARSTTSAR